jgi:hypothetical protein
LISEREPLWGARRGSALQGGRAVVARITRFAGLSWLRVFGGKSRTGKEKQQALRRGCRGRMRMGREANWALRCRKIGRKAESIFKISRNKVSMGQFPNRRNVRREEEGIVVPSGRARSPRGQFPAFWPPDVSARFRKGYPYGHFRGFLNAAGKDHGCPSVRKRRIRSGCSVSSAILFRFTAPHFKHWWIS